MKYSLIILLIYLILPTNAMPVSHSSEDGPALEDDSTELGLIGENNEEIESLKKDDSEESIAKEFLKVDISGENNNEKLDKNEANEASIKDSTNEALNVNESDEELYEDGKEKIIGDDEVENDDSKENIVESTVIEGDSVTGKSTLLEDETLKTKGDTEKQGTILDVFDVAEDDLEEDNIFKRNTADKNNKDEGDEEHKSGDDESKAGLLISVKDKHTVTSGEGEGEEVEVEEDDGEYVTEIVEFTEIVGGNYSGEVDAIKGDDVANNQQESSYEGSSSDINNEKEIKLVGTEVIIEETKIDDKDEKSKKKSGQHRNEGNDDSESLYSIDGSYGQNSGITSEIKGNDSTNNKEKYKNWKDTYQYSITKDFTFDGSSEPKALRQSLIIKTGGFPYRNLPNYIKQDLIKRMPPQADQIKKLQNLFGNGARPSIDSINNALEQILTVKAGSFPEPGAWCCPNSMTLSGFMCHNGVNRVPAEYFNHLTYFKFKDLMCQTGRPSTGPMPQMMPQAGVMLIETPGSAQGELLASGIITAETSGPVMGSLSDSAPFQVNQEVISGHMNGGFNMEIQPWPVQGNLNRGLLSTGHFLGPGGSLPGQKSPFDGADGRSGPGGFKLGAVDSSSSKFSPDLKIQKEVLEGELIPWPGDSVTGFDKLRDIMASRKDVPIPGNDNPPVNKLSSNNIHLHKYFGKMPVTRQNFQNQGMMIPSHTKKYIPRIMPDAMTASGIPMSFQGELKHSIFNDISRAGAISEVNNLSSGSSSVGIKVGKDKIRDSSQVKNGNIKSGLGASSLNSGISSSLTNRMSGDDRFLTHANRFNTGAGEFSSMNSNTITRGSSNLKTGSDFASMTDDSMSIYGSPISSGINIPSLVNNFPRGFESSLIHQQSNLIPEESSDWGGQNSESSKFSSGLFHRDAEEEWVRDNFDSQELLDHQSIDLTDEGLESKDYGWVPNDQHNIYDNLVQDDSHPMQNELNNLIVPGGVLDYTLQDRTLFEAPKGLEQYKLTNPFIADDYLLQDLKQGSFKGNIDLQNEARQQQLAKNSDIQPQLLKDMTGKSFKMDNSFISSNIIDSEGPYDPLREPWNLNKYHKYI